MKQPQLTRRNFLALTPAAAVPATMLDPLKLHAALEELGSRTESPEEIARDESHWAHVQSAFSADRSMINFNNGGVSPSPIIVQDSLARHLTYANSAPAYALFRVQEPRKETVRTLLAELFGADSEEIAITRNASEGLQICQFGFDLEPGDEVLTTDQDYPRMLTTFEQRERRDGIVLKRIPLPVPAEDNAEVVRRFEAALTPRTRMILACHMVNLTGQILPVRELAQLGRRHGIPVIIDGAHAFAHFEFRQTDIDCDYYATSLHKWLFAPFGTGMLYVKRERIADLWPLMAAGESLTDDIRKFEQTGTYPIPIVLAIADAVLFHRALGPARKAARLTYLRDRWARRLAEHERIRLNTSLRPGFACGIANVGIEGIEPSELANYLWRDHRIYTTAIGHDDCRGLRISPSVYSTIEEVDRFADVMERVARNGLPS